MRDLTTKKLVTAALFAAMTCIATMLIKINTPTMGYIHLGDCFVLLSGVLLGPLCGAAAAGIGSMFADIFSGYISWAPATLLIKAAAAATAGLLFPVLQRTLQRNARHGQRTALVLSGISGEALMVFGYFLYEAGIAALGSGALTRATVAAAIATSATGIPFNIVQGIVGIPGLQTEDRE